MTVTRLLQGVFIAIVAAATLLAQGAASAPQDTPTFRSGIQLIDVDVVVTDRDGKPVRDLTRDDFEIIEGRKPQTVRTFSLIDLPFEQPPALAARRAHTVEPDVVSNAAPDGRTYVLLLAAKTDLEAMRSRHVAERWLDEVVQPFDRVAVVHVEGTFTEGQAFTSSRRLILDSINHMIWGTGARALGGTVSVTRELERWRAIKAISERLGSIGGRRKAIVWITDPPILHPLAGAEKLPPLSILDPGSQIAQAWGQILAAWQEAAQTAVHNNVAIYPIDASGLTPEGPSIFDQDAMRKVAEETGGVAVVNTNNFSDFFASILQDASTYYLLGYSPEPEHTDGDFHSIQVRVKRAGVTVRARRGYYAPSAGAKPAKALPAPPEGVSLAAREALRKPVPTKGLAVDVSTVAFKGQGKEASVVITGHVRGQTLDFAAGRRLAVSYQVFDAEGKVATGFYKVFGFNLGNESKARASGTGLQFVERVALKPGRYELRLVAEQPDGPIGSVVAPIEAGKFEDELELSGVALASKRANEVLLVGDRSLRGLLADDATALRRFRAMDGLRAYAEVYTELDQSNPSIRYEVIRVATLTAAITNAAGTVVARGQTQRVSGEPAGKSLREGFRADFDLTRLTPGNYVLTVEARTPSDRKRVATRQIPFVIE